MDRAGETSPVFSMKFKFIGVPGEDHESLHMYGQDFPLGESVKVTNPLAIKKMRNHPHFKATEEASDMVEDVEVKQEFKAVLDAGLKIAEQEISDGNSDGSGAESPAQVEQPRPDGKRQRGRPAKRV